MDNFKQTWWDDNLNNKFEEFISWVGGSDSTSKVIFRKYVKEMGYKSLIDLGCGNATEFFAYRDEYPELVYTGIDSSSFLYQKNVSNGVNMILAPGEETGLDDNYSDVVFSRHVLEHQPNFKPILSEMIRLSKKEAIHVFFIIPGDNVEHIGYDSSQNLYHNRYNKSEIEKFIYSKEKVRSHSWIPISDFECAISIQML
jgi:ubiquinone/menaquinone biosynthesis C-methylase UbiE